MIIFIQFHTAEEVSPVCYKKSPTNRNLFSIVPEAFFVISLVLFSVSVHPLHPGLLLDRNIVLSYSEFPGYSE